MAILVSLALSAGVHAAPTQPSQSGRGVDQQTQAVLKRMSSYMSSLRSFRVEAVTVDEKVTKDGQKIQELKTSQVQLLRPNRVAIDRTGPNGHVIFRYDGKQVAIYGVDKNVYATAPAPPTLEAMLDMAHDRFGVDAPAGDLIVSDAYNELLDGVTDGHYVGLEPIGGVMAHHVAMRKGAVDYQLWVEDGPVPLPLRYVITSRDLPGAPQFTLELHDFEANVPLSAASFELIQPPNAQKVALGNRTRM